MANIFKGLLRANSKANICGDLEGPAADVNKGRLTVSMEKGKCIAWAVGHDDIELSKNTVKSYQKISSDITVKDIPSGGGKPYKVNIYRIEMKDGKTGTLRLLVGNEYKVIDAIS